MNKLSISFVISSLVLAVLGGVKIEKNDPNNFSIAKQQKTATCQFKPGSPNFLVFAGGGDRYSNEIALEKNVLYFQRTLKNMGFNPLSAGTFFAHGNNEEATIRYLDSEGNQQFKAPRIPYLEGATTRRNLQNWLNETADGTVNSPIFFYFTGHGIKNEEDANNNSLLLWRNKLLSVQELSQMLDELPPNIPVVTMMAQCFSGSFANIIYQGGDPNKPVALQTRCGFFATIKTLPSVGCTPEVNEADYEDYSSSFFAGLSGINRVGEKVASADYNGDGKVSY
ncbi:MAG: Caspase domain-containing protein, partial [Okeania sp. SIO2H7]|nr:Caspase domain-containing protein [Okeania sp. SIO2H7]